MRRLRQVMTRNSMAAVVIMAMLLVGTTSFLAAGQKDGARGYLGVNIEKLSQDAKKELGTKHGVKVIRVTKDSAAEKAGIKKDDVILSFNDEKMYRPSHLVEAVRDCKADEKAKISLLRNGKTKNLTVTLGKLTRKFFSYTMGDDDHDTVIYKTDKHGKHGLKKFFVESGKHGKHGKREFIVKSGGAFLGVHLMPLNKELGDYFGAKEGQGVLITKVSKKSPAEKAGLKAGDVIVRIKDKKIADHGDITALLGKMKKGDTVDVHILRHKKKQTMKAKLETEKPRTR